MKRHKDVLCDKRLMSSRFCDNTDKAEETIWFSQGGQPDGRYGDKLLSDSRVMGCSRSVRSGLRSAIALRFVAKL